MSTGAIIMMVLGCGSLWGGCALSCVLAYRYSKKEKQAAQQTNEEK
jgi:hypothetical protein